MTAAELDGIRGVLSRATGTGWEAAYRQDVGRLLDLVGELRLAVETGDAPALDRTGTYTPARGAEAEDLRRELEAIVDAKRPRNVARRVRWVLDSVAARDSLLWLIERDDAEAIRERDAARAAVREAIERIATLTGERDEAQITAADLLEIIGETAWGVDLPALFVRGPVFRDDGTIGADPVPTVLDRESAKQLVEHLYERLKSRRGWLRQARQERDAARADRDTLAAAMDALSDMVCGVMEGGTAAECGEAIFSAASKAWEGASRGDTAPAEWWRRFARVHFEKLNGEVVADRDAAIRETGALRDGVTEALGMPWRAIPQPFGGTGYVCPDDRDIIAAVAAARAEADRLRDDLAEVHLWLAFGCMPAESYRPRNEAAIKRVDEQLRSLRERLAEAVDAFESLARFTTDDNIRECAMKAATAAKGAS